MKAETPESSNAFPSSWSSKAGTIGSQSQSFYESEESATPPTSGRPRRTSSASADEQAIAAHLLGDQPARAEDEKLGFGPYVTAVADFLTDAATKTPLTLSVEGQWGSGKSSFMLQLQQALEKRNRTKVVSFNAWQYNADEGLWAAFIREFDQKLNDQLPLKEKFGARLRLLRLRLSWQDAFETLKMLLWLITSFLIVVAIGRYLLHHLADFTYELHTDGDAGKAAAKTLAVIGGTGGTAAALLLFFTQVRSLLKSPASFEKGTHLFAKPNYSGKLPLIHQIARDFQGLVKAYAGDDDVYIFIDDLDRCEYSKAAELMQALLTLLSSAPNIALIIGLDRDKVAAALAAKQEKLLPFLYNVQSEQVYAVGMQYGHRFLEKFIQLSYTVPSPKSSGLKAMINPSVTPPVDVVPESQKSASAIRIVNGKEDASTLNACIDMADHIFNHNPRNVKQFINAFRLQTFIANETGLFGSGRVTRSGASLTLPQLAKYVALCMRWPRLVQEATLNTTMIRDLEEIAHPGPHLAPGSTREWRTPSSKPEDWVRDTNLMDLLNFGSGPESSLADVDFHKLNEVAPVRAEAVTQAAPPPSVAPPSVSQSAPPRDSNRPSKVARPDAVAQKQRMK